MSITLCQSIFPIFFAHPACIYIYLCKTKHETNRQFLLLVSITRQKYAENDNRIIIVLVLGFAKVLSDPLQYCVTYQC